MAVWWNKQFYLNQYSIQRLCNNLHSTQSVLFVCNRDLTQIFMLHACLLPFYMQNQSNSALCSDHWQHCTSLYQQCEKRHSYVDVVQNNVIVGVTACCFLYMLLPQNRRERNRSCFTCSFVSHCRFGSDRTARTPGVRPSRSIPHGGRTASDWSVGKHIHFPTNARPTRCQNPAEEEEEK